MDDVRRAVPPALAQHLCALFGITVTEPDGEGAPIVSTADGIPRFTIPLNSTVYRELEVRARWFQMLVVDGTDSNLILAKADTTKSASGFTKPGSALDAQASFSKQDRFSVYFPAYFKVDTLFSHRPRRVSKVSITSIQFRMMRHLAGSRAPS